MIQQNKFFLCFLLKVAALAFSQHQPVPTLDHMTLYGCSLESVASTDGWRAYVWAEHGSNNRDWRMLLSEQRGKHAREKSMKDCDRWMRRVRKLLDQQDSTLRGNNPTKTDEHYSHCRL